MNVLKVRLGEVVVSTACLCLCVTSCDNEEFVDENPIDIPTMASMSRSVGVEEWGEPTKPKKQLYILGDTKECVVGYAAKKPNSDSIISSTDVRFTCSWPSGWSAYVAGPLQVSVSFVCSTSQYQNPSVVISQRNLTSTTASFLYEIYCLYNGSPFMPKCGNVIFDVTSEFRNIDGTPESDV